MKRVIRYATMGALGLFLCGCIVSSSPDPDTDIVLTKGEQVSLEVTSYGENQWQLAMSGGEPVDIAGETGTSYEFDSTNYPTGTYAVVLVNTMQGDTESCTWTIIVTEATDPCTDADNDGYAVEGGECGAIDCNDGDASIHPGATESDSGSPVCSDGVDNDCDGQVDSEEPACQSVTPACTDADNDGYAVEGGVCGEVDCNDNDASIHPAATEADVEDAVCSDGVDNDCDGLVDGQEAGCQSIADDCAPAPSGDDYKDRFLTMWCELHDADNGYFSPDGVPYHSIETLLIEAPDHGHETTSEAFSYWIWLEAEYGKITGDWSYLQTAWDTMEAYIIPTHADQPTNNFHNPGSPATYAGEWPLPDNYPSPLNSGVPVGQDPIGQELANTYGTWDIYGMHWLLDVDNTYGYGRRGDGVSTPSYINTFQRGEQESVWETVPHPSWESFNWGGSNGFLDLFIGDGSYARQWRYTNAPDADARVVQAIFWAKRAADANGGSAVVDALAAKAARMGDYLRYSLFDKYFKEIGCQSLNCPGMSGKDSAHYLLSWYYAWGGAADTNAGWTFRIGCSHNHFGYQNPLAAWILSTQSAFIPRSSTAQADWDNSLQRQLEFYRWLQSPQGAIAGGATNSVNGNYESHPAGTSTFYGMAYDDHPVYHDPGSNTWFGWQAWSVERVAEYYYMTGDTLAEQILDDWVPFAVSHVNLTGNDFSIPSELDWNGQPDTWNGASSFTGNPGLSVTVESTGQDVGIAACLTKTLAYYSAGKREHTGTEHAQSRNLAFALMDRMWTTCRDAKGLSVTEARGDYERMDDSVYVPPGWTGTMANGDPINSNSTFLSIRSFYLDDPMYQEVRSALDQGKDPEFNYHRFWAQSEVALANAALSELF